MAHKHTLHVIYVTGGALAKPCISKDGKNVGCTVTRTSPRTAWILRRYFRNSWPIFKVKLTVTLNTAAFLWRATSRSQRRTFEVCFSTCYNVLYLFSATFTTVGIRRSLTIHSIPNSSASKNAKKKNPGLFDDQDRGRTPSTEHIYDRQSQPTRRRNDRRSSRAQCWTSLWRRIL